MGIFMDNEQAVSFKSARLADKTGYKRLRDEYLAGIEGKIFVEVISWKLGRKTIIEIREESFKPENYPNCQFKKVVYRNGIKVPLELDRGSIELKIGNNTIIGYAAGDIFYATIYKQCASKNTTRTHEYKIHNKSRTGKKFIIFNNTEIAL